MRDAIVWAQGISEKAQGFGDYARCSLLAADAEVARAAEMLRLAADAMTLAFMRAEREREELTADGRRRLALVAAAHAARGDD